MLYIKGGLRNEPHSRLSFRDDDSSMSKEKRDVLMMHISSQARGSVNADRIRNAAATAGRGR